MKTIILSTILISSFALAESKPLPNWIDHSRETPKAMERVKGTFTAPPTTKFRTPAEYEPISAVVIGNAGFSGILNDIQKNVLEATNASVWILNAKTAGGLFSSPLTGPYKNRIKKFNCPLDTSWIRDYGPFGIIEGRGVNAIVDPIYRHYQYRVNDDKAPECIASSVNVNDYKIPLILDGGNFLVDSKGNLFMTKRTYLWNKNKSETDVNNLLKAYYGVNNIYTIPYAGYPGEPGDGTGHIDMFVKLLNDETVLIAEANEEPFKTAAEGAVALFSKMTAPTGNKYKILRAHAWYDGRTWYTYTNSLIVNGTVLMPAYKRTPEENAKAQKVYESQGFKVRAIFSDDSIVQGGSIHCLTQTLPAVQ